MGFFKKLTQGTNNVFKKVDSGASHFFKKVDNGFKQAGNFANGVVNDAADAGKKVGNFLEKNSGVISDAAAGALYATGFGAPLATAVLAAGNTGQQLGTRLKSNSSRLQVAGNQLVNQSQAKASDFNNSLNSAVKSAINQGTTTSQNMINQAQSTTNNLGNALNGAIASAGGVGGVQIV